MIYVLFVMQSGDAYTLNMNYVNKRTKFKIMSVTVKETQQETERVRTSTDEDRKWQIQAAIVRIMKSRRVFRHNLLIEEVRVRFISVYTMPGCLRI